MKYHLNGFLIVEGNNDKSYLSSFIDDEILITNGFDIIDLDYMKELNKLYPAIILTDSDESGKAIRNKLNQLLNNCINVEVDISKCNKNNKHGVAECDKNEIISKLTKYFVSDLKNKSNISLHDLVNIGVDNKEKRNYIENYFHLGNCNFKQMVHRLSMLNINKNDILKALKNGN